MNSYINKLENLEEMNKFLDRCKQPIQNQEKIDFLNKLITSTENKFVNVIKKKKKTANKAKELDAFYVGTLLNIHRIKPILLNLFPRWKKMGHSKIHPMRLQLP